MSITEQHSSTEAPITASVKILPLQSTKYEIGYTDVGSNSRISSVCIRFVWNERFSYTDEDIDAYLTFAAEEGYEHIILAGHSLGANKVIFYLSRHRDPTVEHFFLLSPANLTYMMSGVTDREKRITKEQVECGDGDQMLPFPFMGWVECIANTAWDWQFSGLLNNVHTAKDGDPSEFLRNLNDHMPTATKNKLIFIEKTGHTYQMKNQEVADDILGQLQEWGCA